MPMSPYIRRLRQLWGPSRLIIASVAGIVRDSDGRMLLVRQRDGGVWSTPGGAIEPDDTPADAVVRELFEETGLVVRPTRLFAVYGGPEFIVRYPNGDETQYISSMFECEIVSGELHPDGDEVMQARFVSRADAATLPLAPWLVLVIDRLFEQHSAPWFDAPRWNPRQPG